MVLTLPWGGFSSYPCGIYNKSVMEILFFHLRLSGCGVRGDVTSSLQVKMVHSIKASANHSCTLSNFQKYCLYFATTVTEIQPWCWPWFQRWISRMGIFTRKEHCVVQQHWYAGGLFEMIRYWFQKEDLHVQIIKVWKLSLREVTQTEQGGWMW